MTAREISSELAEAKAASREIAAAIEATSKAIAEILESGLTLDCLVLLVSARSRVRKADTFAVIQALIDLDSAYLAK